MMLEERLFHIIVYSTLSESEPYLFVLCCRPFKAFRLRTYWL